MRVLVVNGFPPTNRGRDLFKSFVATIKSTFAELDVHADVSTRSSKNLGDYLYHLGTEFISTESLKRFDRLDMVFVTVGQALSECVRSADCNCDRRG